MTDFRWLIEAPGTQYLAVRKIAYTYEFHWTTDHNAALAFRTEEQADDLMMAVRQLAPKLFAFADNLGMSSPVEHGWLSSSAHDSSGAKAETGDVAKIVAWLWRERERLAQLADHELSNTEVSIRRGRDLDDAFNFIAAAIKAGEYKE